MLAHKMNENHNVITHVLLFCSGVDKSILLQSEYKIEVNKYIGIGGMVFFTGFFAMLSSGYAFYTVFHADDSAFVTAILLGIIWGSFVFTLDFYIVSSMYKQGKPWNDLKLAIPRLILAVLLSLVISKPLELRLFETEIESELISLEQSKFQAQEDSIIARYKPQIEAVKSRFKPDIDALTKEIKAIGKRLAAKEAIRNKWQKEIQDEIDGKNGRPPGCGTVCKEKKVYLKQAQQEIDEIKKLIAPKLALLDNKQALLDNKLAYFSSLKTKDLELLREKRKEYRGLAARLEAFSNLTANNPSVSQANIFIILLFIVIETAPIFVKLISHQGLYDKYLVDINNGKKIDKPSIKSDSESSKSKEKTPPKELSYHEKKYLENLKKNQEKSAKR